MRDILAAKWSEVGDKIVLLAQEFPEDRYDHPPVPGVRSFADQLRHVAFWNAYVAKTLKGQKPDGQANELDRAAYPSKSKLLPALQQSFADVKTELAKSSNPPEPADVDSLISFIEHNGEHYGQLAVYSRFNGVVPPASRTAT